jgi:hypothetical protein
MSWAPSQRTWLTDVRRARGDDACRFYPNPDQDGRGVVLDVSDNEAECQQYPQRGYRPRVSTLAALTDHAVAIAMALALGDARARATADLDREDARLAAAQLLRYLVDVRRHQPMNRMPTTGLSRTLRLRCWHESGKLGRAGRAGRANVASLGKTAAVRALASRGRGRVTVA